MKAETTLYIALTSAALLFACNNGATATPAAEPPVETAEHAADDHGAEETEATAQAPTSMPHGSHDHAGHADEGDHAGHDHGEHDEGMENVLEEGEYDPADLVAQPGAAVGDITTCPVSGEVFRVTDDSPFFEHAGDDIYFCCARCIRRFQRDPDSFLSAAGGGAAAAGGPMVEVSAEGTSYDPPVAKSQVPTGSWICDMGTVHYARSEQGDGRCPLCGMNLVEH